MNVDDAIQAAEEHLTSSAPDDGAAPVPDTAAEPISSPPDSPAAEPAPSSQPESPQRARAEDGTFTKSKTGAEPAKKPAALKGAPDGAAPLAAAGQGKPAAAVPPTPAAGQPVVDAPAIKAPQSWTPAAREAFAKAPPEVQREVTRRETEITRTLQETAQARQVASQVRETLAPFEGLARANGMDSLRYAGSVMQTAAALHMGTPVQKAHIVAQLIRAYAIDVDGVNAVMQGQAPAQTAQPPQDVGQLVEQALQARIQQATETRATQAWQEFESNAPEFLADVKDAMREILMVAGQQGRTMTYQQAYDRACKMDEGVSETLAQRKSAAAARTAQPVTPAARAAASSIRSRPAVAPAAQSKGLDAAMRAAADKLGM